MLNYQRVIPVVFRGYSHMISQETNSGNTHMNINEQVNPIAIFPAGITCVDYYMYLYTNEHPIYEHMC